MHNLGFTHGVLCCSQALGMAAMAAAATVPDGTIVLTFDDAVRSHLAFVAPLLQENGFGATFFVSHRWLDDQDNFLNWEEVGQLDRMGFEVGNHSWTHSDFGQPRMAARLGGELALVESALEQVGVSKPSTFAWPGNGFSPEGVRALQARGYRFARRGMQPEVPYGQVRPGPLYDPRVHHPLLIPTAGDAYPGWDLEAFREVVDRARDGCVAVLQFHGVPDRAHPWVNTPPERFAEYVAYLKENGFNVIALRDLERYVEPTATPEDAMAAVRYFGGTFPLELPPEITATRADLRYWLDNMLTHHRFSVEEAARVCDYPESVLRTKAEALGLLAAPAARPSPPDVLEVVPYPGGRHPRIGFLEGAVDPVRGTKFSVFPPWDGAGYVVVDLPEALWSNLGLTFLAHTHIPTIWDNAHAVLDNVDWTRLPSGVLEFERPLPNGIHFGSRVTPQAEWVDLEFWLENGSPEPLTGLRAQICIMLGPAEGFAYQDNAPKRYEQGVAAAPSLDGRRWVLTAFERCAKAWGNPRVPCIHSDPALPNAAPGERVHVKGRLWFYEGDDIDGEIARGSAAVGAAPAAANQ